MACSTPLKSALEREIVSRRDRGCKTKKGRAVSTRYLRPKFGRAVGEPRLLLGFLFFVAVFVVEILVVVVVVEILVVVVVVRLVQLFVLVLLLNGW